MSLNPNESYSLTDWMFFADLSAKVSGADISLAVLRANVALPHPSARPIV